MLNSFQLRSARSVTGIGVREVASYLGVSRGSISNWENQSAFKILTNKAITPDGLEFFFAQYHITFPDQYSIKLNIEDTIPSGQTEGITRFQLRAARAALNLTQEQLANYLQLQRPEISYLEEHRNAFFLEHNKRSMDCKRIKLFFEQKGINFINNFSVTLNPTSFQDVEILQKSI
jgi:transcriptional regulator with XRE-family HTH domain